MCLGNDLFQALLDSAGHPFVCECGGCQSAHRGNWLAQVMSSLLDGSWPLLRIGQISPGRRRGVDRLSHCPAFHVPHPE